MIADKIVFRTIKEASINRENELRKEVTDFIEIWKELTEGINCNKFIYLCSYDDWDYYLYTGSRHLRRSYSFEEYNFSNDPIQGVSNLSYEKLIKISSKLESKLKRYFEIVQENTQYTIDIRDRIARINRKLSDV